MTPQNKLIGIREMVIKAVPEIMELKFGTQYFVKKGGIVHTLRKDYLESGYCGQCQEGNLNGQAFTNYRCGYCKKGFSHHNTGVPKYCLPCAQKHKVCRYCACYLEIIGRPIRLTDLMVPMEEAGWWDNTQCGVKDGKYFWRVSIDLIEGSKLSPEERKSLPDFIKKAIEENEKKSDVTKESKAFVFFYWNLTQDDLSKQSEETIDFLYSLLVGVV